MPTFPDGKRFAFSVFDDTDFATLDNVRPVYDFLSDLGFRTTKSVWPLPNHPDGPIGGATLDDDAYRRFILELQDEGFEIGLHNVRNFDANRDTVIRGVHRFRQILGVDPATHCNHISNKENLYWGDLRVNSPWMRAAYNLATRFRRRNLFKGHDPTSRFFWGDLSLERGLYVRNFVFDEINLDRINPSMPYHDPAKPFVRLWFSSCEGGEVRSFVHTIREEQQDRLLSEGGVCIMYTHFAKGFCEHGKLHPGFERLMRRLAALDGWFVPVRTLLEHLKAQRGGLEIPRAELGSMERRWSLRKLRTGTT
jgi:hypothetical protein